MMVRSIHPSHNPFHCGIARSLLAFALLVASSSGVSAHSGNGLIDIEITREVDLRLILKTIASRGSFNVSFDPSVEPRSMALRLRDVEPIEALETICKLNGLRISRASGAGSSHSFVVSKPAIRESSGCGVWTRKIRLSSIPATGAVRDLQARFTNVFIGAADEGRSVIIRAGDQWLIDAVVRRVREIDC